MSEGCLQLPARAQLSREWADRPTERLAANFASPVVKAVRVEPERKPVVHVIRAAARSVTSRFALP